MRFALIGLALLSVSCRPLDPSALAGSSSLPADAAGQPVVYDAGSEMADAFGIIDGDTFRLGDETIRIANIDTPEMPPRSRCWAEARLARLATDELQRLQAGGQLRLQRQGRDRYGRTLALVSFDGGRTDAGERLIAEGFAVPWVGHRWNWCDPVTTAPEGAKLVRP